ncbi:MAG: YsnF/AvaK domain-containing protein [Candidatus Eremiobacteraeota bacterium]|nr:YsnF/AvaK domain-containing protein [Candidatus Eremiobacteraeota bacterium]
MTYEKIVTVFDTAEHANRAVDALQRAGFDRAEMHPITKTDVNAIDSAAHGAVRQAGFWHRLLGDDVVEYEGNVYSRAVENGGTVLTVRVPDTDADRAMTILHQVQPVDIEHRAAQLGLVKPAVEKPVAVAASEVPVATAVAATSGAKEANDQVLRLAEEQLQVGKEQVDAGSTKVRRYVVEKPVEAQVSLHEEHADVVRRAVKDPNYVGDIDWDDRTIVVTETAERALVSKVPRITEEVVIRREGSDRVQTIRDTVRRQQVDVERSNADKTKSKL